MFSEKLLAGRNILVTGGGTGLGKSLAARFLELGAEAHICGRRKIVCDETATELMDLYGGRVTSHGVDIRNAQAVDEMVDAIFLDSPLTDLINNAAGNFIARTEDLSPRGFDAVANIVMHGTFYVTHAVGRRWIANKLPGSGVSITVTLGRTGSPCARAANPMGRVGTMEELQNLAVFLISGGCDWINGETIAMDGGQALAMGGNFYQLRDWTDSDWQNAKEQIKAQNEKHRAARG